MKLFSICATEKRACGFHPAILIVPTAELALRKVKLFLHEDLMEFLAIDEFEYERELERLDKSFKDYLNHDEFTAFFSRFYYVTEVNFEEE